MDNWRVKVQQAANMAQEAQEQREDRANRISQAGKSADAFFKAMPEALQKAGVADGDYQNLSAMDKAGLMAGVISANTQKENQAKVEWLQGRLQQQQEEAQAWPQLFQSLRGQEADVAKQNYDLDAAEQAGYPVPEGARPKLPAMPERMTQALAQMGQTSPRLAGALAKQVLPQMMQGGEADEGMQFEEDPVSGFRFASKGKVVQPSGVNPAKNTPQVLPQHDEDGNLIGYSTVDGRGRATFTKASGPALTPAVDADTQEPIPGFYMDGNGKMIDTRSAIQKMTGDAGQEPGQDKAPAKSSSGTAARAKSAVPTGKVRMKAPDGKVGYVPASQRAAAVKQGYTMAP